MIKVVKRKDIYLYSTFKVEYKDSIIIGEELLII